MGWLAEVPSGSGIGCRASIVDGAQGRVPHDNELLEAFQRNGLRLPQGGRP